MISYQPLNWNCPHQALENIAEQGFLFCENLTHQCQNRSASCRFFFLQSGFHMCSSPTSCFWASESHSNHCMTHHFKYTSQCGNHDDAVDQTHQKGRLQHVEVRSPGAVSLVWSRSRVQQQPDLMIKTLELCYGLTWIWQDTFGSASWGHFSDWLKLFCYVYVSKVHFSLNPNGSNLREH